MSAASATLALAVVAALALAGCSSSFDQAKKLEREGAAGVGTQRGLTIAKANPDVKVGATATVTDENGSAVVVTLRSRAKRTQVDVPVAIDVLGRGRKSVFKNDTPGLEPSLVEAPVVPPGTSEWVNDQVQPSAPPASVDAKVGIPKQAAPARLPKLTVTGVKLEDDPTSGLLAQGTVTNASPVPQVKLVAFGVVRKGDRLVAAGRAVVPKLRPGRRAIFRIFFIGDPRKGKLTVTVPPSTVR